MIKTDRTFFWLVIFCLPLLICANQASAINITSSVNVDVLPLPPSNLSVTANAYNQIGLSWTDNSNNETEFSVEKKIGGSGIYSELTRVGANIGNYVDNNISANTTYYYRIRAFLGNTPSIYSDEASSTTPSAPIPPTPPPATSGSGGGGGGGYTSPPAGASAQATFRGKAYPKSSITLLKDAQISAVTVAGEDANFEITLTGLTPGAYSFGIWAEDIQGNRSVIHQFNISLTGNASTLVSGIFIAPSISTDKLEVKRGEPIKIFGSSAPSSTVSIFINSEQEIVKKINSDDQGDWLYKLDSSELEYGDHSAKATAAKDGDITNFSKSVGFKIGLNTVLTPKTEKKVELKIDPSGDGKVNLVDFSILAYWYKRPISNISTAVKSKIDINNDGKVDLKDFSILAYHWTG